MKLNRDPVYDLNSNNFFSNIIKRYSDESPFVHMKPDQIQKMAKERLFREMVKGQIDYSLYGKYFLDPKFIGNILIAANDELNNNSTLSMVLEYYDLCNPNDPRVTNLLIKHRSLVQIYGVIVDRLNQVSMYENPGYLTDISYILANFRNII